MASKDIYSKEADFHDRWADSVLLDDVKIIESFESPTMPENSFILSKLVDVKGKKLLDIGSGQGEAAIYFALKGADTTLVDISPGMVRLASDLAKEYGVSIRTSICAAEHMDCESNYFDFVYLGNVIHHVKDRRLLFEQVLRVLKPGGYFYSYDPLRYNPIINIYRLMATENRSEDESPLGKYDYRLVTKYFINCGHREFWLTSLVLFLKYYVVDRKDPGKVKYWKQILRENTKTLWWWFPFLYLDKFLTKIPGLRWLSWNIVMWGQKPVI
ncbi:MAG: class I SAM-dependent methyltransferase [Desulforudis sp.]|jgi:SAM-dependent methyltransferase|nr:MAG: class I SAM-dependent methyltransferase [Desulforudis sp.]